MTTFNKALFSCIGACIFVAVPLAHAEIPGTGSSIQKAHSSPSGQAAGQRIREIYAQLDLTDEQKQKLEANKEQHRSKMEEARQEMKANKEALRAELMKPQLDMPKINGIHDRIKVLQNQMEDEKLSSILVVRGILTPEQFLKFITLMHKHREEHGEQGH